MPAHDERPVRRARRVAWAWRGRAPSTHGTLYSPTSPQQAPADIGRSHALEDGLGALPELTGRRTDPSPPARAPALALSRAQRPLCSFQPFLCRLQPFQRRPAGLGDGLGRPRVADVEWVGLGGSGRCCLGREASAISVDRWGKPQNWPRQSPGTRRGIAPLPARRMARFDRLTRFF